MISISPENLDIVITNAFIDGRKTMKKEVLKLIKAWNGYGDDRFPGGEVKELIREIKKLKEIPKSNNNEVKR